MILKKGWYSKKVEIKKLSGYPESGTMRASVTEIDRSSLTRENIEFSHGRYYANAN